MKQNKKGKSNMKTFLKKCQQIRLTLGKAEEQKQQTTFSGGM